MAFASMSLVVALAIAVSFAGRLMEEPAGELIDEQGLELRDGKKNKSTIWRY